MYICCNLSATKTGLRYGQEIINQCHIIHWEFYLRMCLIKPHVSDISKYCLHSLRSGGATAAANNGIADRLFI